MTPFTATRFDYILTIRRSHAGSEARGSFPFTAGAAQGALRHSSEYRMRLVKGLGSKRPQFSSVQSYHLHPVVFGRSWAGLDEVVLDGSQFTLNRTVKPASDRVGWTHLGH
jgi:hypothetical protein